MYTPIHKCISKYISGYSKIYAYNNSMIYTTFYLLEIDENGEENKACGGKLEDIENNLEDIKYIFGKKEENFFITDDSDKEYEENKNIDTLTNVLKSIILELYSKGELKEITLKFDDIYTKRYREKLMELYLEENEEYIKILVYLMTIYIKNNIILVPKEKIKLYKKFLSELGYNLLYKTSSINGCIDISVLFKNIESFIKEKFNKQNCLDMNLVDLKKLLKEKKIKYIDTKEVDSVGNRITIVDYKLKAEHKKIICKKLKEIDKEERKKLKDKLK